MSKSIIQKGTNCYICEQLGFDTPGTDTHHIIHGTANRQISEEDGLTVRLCRYHHTRLHDKGEWDRELQYDAQMEWMEHYNKSIKDFRNRYGKSFI